LPLNVRPGSLAGAQLTAFKGSPHTRCSSPTFHPSNHSPIKFISYVPGCSRDCWQGEDTSLGRVGSGQTAAGGSQGRTLPPRPLPLQWQAARTAAATLRQGGQVQPHPLTESGNFVLDPELTFKLVQTVLILPIQAYYQWLQTPQLLRSEADRHGTQSLYHGQILPPTHRIR